MAKVSKIMDLLSKAKDIITNGVNVEIAKYRTRKGRTDKSVMVTSDPSNKLVVAHMGNDVMAIRDNETHTTRWIGNKIPIRVRTLCTKGLNGELDGTQLKSAAEKRAMKAKIREEKHAMREQKKIDRQIAKASKKASREQAKEQKKLEKEQAKRDRDAMRMAAKEAKIAAKEQKKLDRETSKAEKEHIKAHKVAMKATKKSSKKSITAKELGNELTKALNELAE